MDKETVQFIVETPILAIRFLFCLLPYAILIGIIHCIWNYLKRFFLSDIAKKRSLNKNELDLLDKQIKKEEARYNQ